MAKRFEIDLEGIPWPANLLQCHQMAEAMGPGDRLSIRLEDGDLKASLELILESLPGHKFETRPAAGGYQIRVVRNLLSASGREELSDGGTHRHIFPSKNT